jgi:hypothetical protein
MQRPEMFDHAVDGLRFVQDRDDDGYPRVIRARCIRFPFHGHGIRKTL